ncbi:MAG: PAS domain-containing protein [Campylobacterota bacterium]|nr:PAS domain-containing protein [Campylobacterota bacterium]
MKELSFSEDQIIVSKTDTKGKITYCNDIFIMMSGYKENELLSKSHNILRHRDMPKIIFQLLWQTVQSGEEINAYVKNKTKDGNYYWVFANVTPSMDNNNNIIGYFSVRRKPSSEALRVIEPLYRELLRIENTQGVTGSHNYLMNILDKKEVSYEEFIISI